jgi:hypothetical protein
MAVEHSKIASQVRLLELMLEQVKQMLTAADEREPSSFMRFKGALQGWLDADETLLAECRLKFEDPCRVS